jgi:phosphoglycerol transferase MdoB-like AlkP superfamily enzyme
LFFVNIDVSAIPARIIGTHTLVHVSANNGVVGHVSPSPYMVIPFILLLIMIATAPLFYKRFWEKHYPKVSIVLGLLVAVYITATGLFYPSIVFY